MDMSRKKPVLKNRVPEHVEKAVVDLAIENPVLGQKRASRELQPHGIMISSSGVRSVWLRHDLETMKKRLKALEARSAQEGFLLSNNSSLARFGNLTVSNPIQEYGLIIARDSAALKFGNVKVIHPIGGEGS